MARYHVGKMWRYCRKGLGMIALSAVAAAVPDTALAFGAGGGTPQPWEAPLETIARSLSGPVAFVISLLGLFGTGAALMFGGEINEFIRRLIMMVLVISLLIFATNILSGLFGVGMTLEINAGSARV